MRSFNEELNSSWLRVARAFRFVTTGLAVIASVSIGMTQSALGQTVKFTSPVTYPAGNPFVVTAGDFNGDGKMDLVAAGSDLVMLLGNGDGTLRPPVTYHLAEVPYELVAADFNRDGKLDLAIRNSSPATSFSICSERATDRLSSQLLTPLQAAVFVSRI